MWYRKSFISTSMISLCPTYIDVTNHPNDCCKLGVPCLVDFVTLCGHGIEEGLEIVPIGLVDWWLNLWFCIDDWLDVFVAWLNVLNLNEWPCIDDFPKVVEMWHEDDILNVSPRINEWPKAGIVWLEDETPIAWPCIDNFTKKGKKIVAPSYMALCMNYQFKTNDEVEVEVALQQKHVFFIPWMWLTWLYSLLDKHG